MTNRGGKPTRKPPHRPWVSSIIWSMATKENSTAEKGSEDWTKEQNEALGAYKLSGLVGKYVDPTRDQKRTLLLS